MTIGEKLFVRILKDKDSRMLSTIDKEWLEGDEVVMYKFIISYFKEYSKLPTLKLFRGKFSIKDISIKDEASYFLDEVRGRYIHITLVDEMPRLIKASLKDPLGSIDTITDIISKLASTNGDSELFSYGSDSKDRFAEYAIRIEKGGVLYLPTGDSFFTALLYGYKENDLLTIGGRPGTKKTWILIYLIMVLDAILKEHLKGRCLLFVSNEIGVKELQDRMDCMKYRLSYTRFLAGDLSRKEINRYEKGLKKRGKSSIKITTKCRRLADLELLVKIYNPAMVFLDGSYLMEPSMKTGWEKVTFITQNLKAISLSSNVPIINTTQSSRRRGGGVPKDGTSAQDDFAFADSYSQDSDVAMLLYPDADSKWNDKLNGIVAKGRSIDITKANFVVHAPLDTMKFKFAKVEEKIEEEDVEPVVIDY